MDSSATEADNNAATSSNSDNNDNPMPRLALPEAICSMTPGTWAYDTMARRVNEEILERTWEDNKEVWQTEEWSAIKERFEALRNELAHAGSTKITHLDPPALSEERQKEYDEWYRLLQPFVDADDTWLSAPWMVTEFYVYRRLMQAIGYWTDGNVGYQYDPFAKSKYAGLVSSVASAEAMLAKINTLTQVSTNAAATKEGITLAAAFALWGNKMDLSLWPADASKANVDIFSAIVDRAGENLLHDDSARLADYCLGLAAAGGGGGGNVDIIIDNAGFELVTDLALAQYLIQSGIAKVVTFQLKSHPTFVSDALEKDLRETVEYYATSTDINETDYPNVRAAGKRWQSFLENGQWSCHEDNFWVQPFAMWDMTEPLRSDLVERCDLAFVKGDANYRRLLGDRTWDYSAASFEDVVGAYFPCKVCALRTLKAEVGCGMATEQVERAKALDDNWLVNGRFGVVHFGEGAGK